MKKWMYSSAILTAALDRDERGQIQALVALSARKERQAPTAYEAGCASERLINIYAYL